MKFSLKSRTEEVILHGNKDDDAEFKRNVFKLEVPYYVQCHDLIQN